MDDGTATSMAAKPPHASPDRSVTPDFDLIAVNAMVTPSRGATLWRVLSKTMHAPRTPRGVYPYLPLL
jgi:hypothetical protein